MKVVSLVKNNLSVVNSGATYSYEYYNENQTSTAVGSSYLEYNPATTYNADDYVSIASIKRVFRCTIDGTIGSFPPANPSLWTDYGATNSFALFDNTISTQTQSDLDFTITFDFNQINTLAILNMENITSVRIRQSGTTIDKTISMRDFGVLSLYDYWYKPTKNTINFKKLDMQWLPSSTVTIDFIVLGVGKVGSVVSGYLDELGLTLYGTSVGFDDNSIYETDDYGMAKYLKRPSIDILEAKALINTNEVDYTIAKLKQIRGTTSLYIGDERDKGFQSMTILGYIRKIRMDINNPQKTEFPISIIGVA
jgi:hypothetical protein